MYSATYQSLLKSTNIQPHYILEALHLLDHVIFLENQGKPFIAFCVEQYTLVQEGKVQTYQAKVFNEYIKIENELDFTFQSVFKNNSEKFNGGYIGFFSYDYAAQQQVQYKQRHQPALFIGQFSTYLELGTEGWLFKSYAPNAEEIFQKIQALIDQYRDKSEFSLVSPCIACWDKSAYQQAFNQVQEYIKAGDCYQINLTQEFSARAKGSLLTTAEQFWQLTNAPYAGYLRIGEFELLSCSPELFIEFQPERKILTKPIKGTMPRYADPILDAQSKQTLKNSEKDQAENVMIVDLLRNDLSVYAETGSVKTPKLFNIESFKQVHHMVSEVEATLKEGINPFDVLMSALPGGSITGAPKIRAMQIIEELENAPRGAYCGSLGYFNFDGTGSWNILIRSIQKYQDEVSLWAGGGITIASDCDAEYQECFDKVEAMLNLLNAWYKPE
ncbi:aminodeoxychorismate synthase component I [Acinetobacter sp. LoGeW2-3]|uniref:anthranilate synthase component I family protein n=1 Tax=Acinetobacter sp. LoGeW2-3 TaxID=1808001 RepID=UPI000C058A75|nr:anthranilate synthase component I family protein [Acinetobacter sp. LoGeW2-3]ATO19623.1 aminodeoxychorismate synthase component I [Acinetobacter sp. LoGeW2-3]